MTTNWEIWVSAILTLGGYSILFSENKFFQLVEHIFVGVGAGFAVVVNYYNIVNKGWNPMVQKGEWWIIIPMVLGVMLFGRFVKGMSWVTRLPISLLVGIGVSLALRGAVQAELVQQISSSFVNVIGKTPGATINNLIMVVGTIGTVMYFFFTYKQNIAVKTGSSIGKWIMMLAFGAAFGNAVQGRISLLISRMQFLFTDWIHLIK